QAERMAPATAVLSIGQQATGEDAVLFAFAGPVDSLDHGRTIERRGQGQALLVVAGGMSLQDPDVGLKRADHGHWEMRCRYCYVAASPMDVGCRTAPDKGGLRGAKGVCVGDHRPRFAT